MKHSTPIVKVKPRSYQPSRAELREKIHIPTTPEQLAKSSGPTCCRQYAEMNIFVFKIL